jgi:hypothetical protein
MVRIPCLNVGDPHLVTASDVAMMDYVRYVLKVPCPRVISCSSDAKTNAAGTEFIIMEKVAGVSYYDRWILKPPFVTLKDLVKGVVKVEAACASARFSQFGSLYYKEDVSSELQTVISIRHFQR